MKPELGDIHHIRSVVEQVWSESVLGEYVKTQEHALYNTAVFDLFGLHAVQMGCAKENLLENSRIPNRHIASDYETPLSDLRCDDDFLPFAENSMDLLLLPHRLEFSERPHQTLREADRVMMPDGHVIISGFNPWSSWGLKFVFKKILHRYFFKRHDWYPEDIYPWHAQLISLRRLKDWLALLGFEVISVKKACHVPPFNSEKLHRRFTWIDRLCQNTLSRVGCNQFGGVYFVVAKKRVPGVTPLKPKWKAAHLAEGLIPRPNRSKTHQNKQSDNQ